jgi:hypothetical protein
LCRRYVTEFIKSLRAQLLVEKERVAVGLPSTGGGALHMAGALHSCCIHPVDP